MADYTLLKEAIQQVIKTNGNQEITGLLLQQALLSLIDDLNLTKQDKINFVTNAVTRFLKEDGTFQEIPAPTGSLTQDFSAKKLTTATLLLPQSAPTLAGGEMAIYGLESGFSGETPSGAGSMTNITLSLPTGLEVSLDNTNFAQSKQITGEGGTFYTRIATNYFLPTTTQWATKLDTSLKGSANGLAELDENGFVKNTQLPSYIDDVIEADNFAALPAIGETGKIYVTKDDNKTWRWGGSIYVQMYAGIALGETSSTAYRGDRGKIAYDYSQIGHLPLTGGTLSGNVGLGATPLTGGSDARWITLNGTTTYSGGVVYSIGGVAKAYSYADAGYLLFQSVSGIGQQFLPNGQLALTLNTDKSAVFTSSVTIGGALSGVTTLSASGIVSLNNTTQSTAYTNGGLVLSGGLGIAKDLFSNGKGSFKILIIPQVAPTLASGEMAIYGLESGFSGETPSGAGSVESVALVSNLTGISVTGSPITTSGTFTLNFVTGYSIPTNIKQGEWDNAYTNRITSLTTTGSGAATLIGNVLNIPTYLTEITKAQVEGVLTGAITTHTHSYLSLSGGQLTGDLGLGVTPLTGGSLARWITLNGTTSYSGGVVYSIGGVAKAYSYADAGYLLFQSVSGIGQQFLPNGQLALTLNTDKSAVFTSSVQMMENINTNLRIPKVAPTSPTSGQYYFYIVE